MTETEIVSREWLAAKVLDLENENLTLRNTVASLISTLSAVSAGLPDGVSAEQFSMLVDEHESVSH